MNFGITGERVKFPLTIIYGSRKNDEKKIRFMIGKITPECFYEGAKRVKFLFTVKYIVPIF